MWAPPAQIPTVAELIDATDQKVSGLKEQKQRLAVALVRHALNAARGRQHVPANVLILGPTGGGKSYMVRCMLEEIGLPFVETNATQYSEIGFVGLDLRNMFVSFTEKPWVNPGEKAADVIPLAERWGVVVLDEVDKWRFIPNPKERQVGKALQAELLKILEGDTVFAAKQDNQRGFPFRTHNILFIGIGAFEGLEDQIRRERLPDHPHPHMMVEPLDIQKHGFLMELVGRFPNLLPLPPLEPTAIAAILAEHVLPRYQREAEDMGLQLITTHEALVEVAAQAIQKKTGARALMTIMENLLWRALAQAEPGSAVVLDVQEVLGQRARVA